MAEPKPNPIPFWRRLLRPRFSLRMLFVVMTLACYGMYKTEQAWRQERVAKQIYTTGRQLFISYLTTHLYDGTSTPINAHPFYDYDSDDDLVSMYDLYEHELRRSDMMVTRQLENLFGFHFVHRLTCVVVPDECAEHLLPHLKKLPHLREVLLVKYDSNNSDEVMQREKTLALFKQELPGIQIKELKERYMIFDSELIAFE